MLIRFFFLCSLLLYEASWGLKNPHPPDYVFEHRVFDLLDEGLEPTEIHIIPDLRFNKYLDTINCRGRHRPESFQIIVISRIFTNRTVLERHAMVHEALRDEMLKREAGCAIDIHADTPEEWNEFKIRNDFDEVSGKPDWRARSLKTTPKLVIDTKLRDKVYNYIKLHFRPVVLHVVDSKHMHPVDNDNPAFDVLLVSHHFCNLTITQRTMLMHDYLRDFINEGIQFRLHCLQSPEEVWPERFNEDGIESALLTPIHNLREYMNVYNRYVPPPTHVVNLNYNLVNKISVLEEAKRKLREHDEMMKAPG